jgi:hypothetical protein
MRKRPIISIVLAALLLGLLFVAFVPGAYWDGVANVTFPTVVQDAASGQPVTGARVKLLNQRGPAATGWFAANRGRPPFVTDTTGCAKVIWLFGTGGRSHIFWKTGSVGFKSWNLEVSAPGYETLVTPLSEYAGESRSIWRSMRIPITVQLKPIVGGMTSQASR